MKTTNKYFLTIGLLKSDMKTRINQRTALNVINKHFLKKGIIGFSVEYGTGFYKGLEEPNIKISFVNTYNLYQKDIIKITELIRNDLKQDCILIEEQKKVLYNFI